MPIKHVVIGANYGDEGKGQTSAWLASLEPTRPGILRVAGGPQCSHTVNYSDGTPRVYKSLGVAFDRYQLPVGLGADYLLSPRHVLEELDETPAQVFIHPSSRLITPLDIILNQVKETFRKQIGENHGSCGMGIGECVDRNMKSGSTLTWGYVAPTLEAVMEALQYSRDKFQEFIEENVDNISYQPFSKVIYDHPGIALINSWNRTGPTGLRTIAENFLNEICTLRNDDRISLLDKKSEFLGLNLIVEGNQGMGLDENDKAHFPHVTRSPTRLRGFMKSFRDGLWIDEFGPLNVHYVTRPYLTRHGAGPNLYGSRYWMENGEMITVAQYLRGFRSPFVVPKDTTNVPNEYQGSIKIDTLNWTNLEQRIDHDFAIAPAGSSMAVQVTCMNEIQPGDTMKYHLQNAIDNLRKHGKTVEFPPETIPATCPETWEEALPITPKPLSPQIDLWNTP